MCALLFSSIPFIYYFLAAIIILYFAVPKKIKNLVLLIFSLGFYGWGEPKNVFIMIFAIASSYVFGMLIDRFRGEKISRLFLTLSIVVSVGMLGYYKYCDFFIENINAVTGLSLPLLKVALPIGISFYTFQLLSYTVDVYHGNAAVQRNPLALGTYITMFPQLIAGPIVRYSDLAAQLTERSHTIEKAALGIRRLLIGLGKKILIANVLGEICSVFEASDDRSVLYYWLYAIAFALQIYFDFSGYSDMAIGLGKIFGFEFMENFNYPFISCSITEFWRRWHISLGSWFRDYIYIPMGGNRVSKPRWFFNILVVWMLTGFWHGAAWNFIIWGLFFAVLLVTEKLWLLKKLEKTKIVNHIYVLFFVLISFVIFNSTSFATIFENLGGMFGFSGVPVVSAEFVYYLRNYAVILIAAVIGATPLPCKAVEAVRKTKHGESIINVLEVMMLAALLIAVTAYLVNGSFNPFLYFRF